MRLGNQYNTHKVYYRTRGYVAGTHYIEWMEEKTGLSSHDDKHLRRIRRGDCERGFICELGYGVRY